MEQKPSKDFSTRYTTAKRWRDNIRPDIEETLLFCCPGREKDFARNPNTARNSDSETFTSLPEELATDLAGDLVTYYTPAEVTWCDYQVITDVPEDIQDEVAAEVDARRDELFSLIQASNYNDVAPQWGFETATHGTPALWVDVAHIAQPVHVEVVPPHELLITPGHLGLLDRFRETTVMADTLPALLGRDVDLSDQKIQDKLKKPGSTVKVCWGFWIDWTDPGNPLWLREITVDGARVTPEKELLGPLAGSCPLLVGRFNPQPGRPWGRGAGLKALQEMRVTDAVVEANLEAIDQSVRTTLIYPDDGFLDLSNGVIAGSAIPAHRGFTRDSIYDLSRSVNVDQAFISEERQEEKLRRLFYQDGPRQRGDTPPTAAQWLDERRRVQQRLGKPSAPLWTELILPMVQRFETLAVQLGRLPDAITHDGQSISVTPISPLQKAQNQDKVMTTRSNLDMAFAVFQDRLPEVIDMKSTMQNIIRTSGDELTVLATEAPVAAPAPPQ